jgi:ABC-type phosphate transport system substrate-binding protein
MSYSRRAAVGLALAGAVVASIVFAGGGSAAPPTSGNACTSDGKIFAIGATFQTRAQQAWASQFEADVCGSQTNANDASAGTTAGQMVSYNQYAPFPSINGSGYGRKAILCRAADFAGTDTPFDNATLQQLNQSNPHQIFLNGGVPDAGATAIVSNCHNTVSGASAFGDGTVGNTWNPPFPPNDASNLYPATGDTQANIMAFPVTGSAVAVAVNLHGKDSTGTNICSSATVPASLNLTPAMVEGLIGGSIKTWGAAALTAGGLNSTLTTDGCTGAVTRIVRFDSSGTTQIYKNFLNNFDSLGTTVPCDGITWNNYWQNANNQKWPGLNTTTGQGSPGSNSEAGAANAQGTGGNANCSAIIRGDISGNPGVLDVTSGAVAITAGAWTTAGGSGTAPTGGFFGYFDLPDLENFSCTGSCTNFHVLQPSNVQAFTAFGTNTGFQSPSASQAANCNFGVMSLPTSSINLDVDGSGVPIDTWAFNNTVGGNHGDVTDQGSKYPICGVTFDMIPQGLGGGSGGPGSASGINGMNANQRYTEYSYFNYILSSAGQNLMNSFFYASLPDSVINQIRSDFEDTGGY